MSKYTLVDGHFVKVPHMKLLPEYKKDKYLCCVCHSRMAEYVLSGTKNQLFCRVCAKRFKGIDVGGDEA